METLLRFGALVFFVVDLCCFFVCLFVLFFLVVFFIIFESNKSFEKTKQNNALLT